MHSLPRRIVAAGLLAVLVGLSIVGRDLPTRARSAAPAQAGQETPSSVSVSLPIVTTPQGGRRILVPVSVAGGPERSLIFDTGSTGVIMFADAVGAAGLQKTDMPLTAEYGDGTLFQGVLAYAPVTIAGVTTAAAIAIMLVEQVGCTPSQPTCETAGGFASWESAGEYGVAGAGLVSSGLFNPLSQVPGALGGGFLIDTGGAGSSAATLTLGLTPDNTAGFVRASLSAEPGVQTPSGGTVWNDRSLSVCFTFGPGPSGQPPATQPVCGATAFDTGSQLTAFLGDLPAALVATNTIVVSGTPVRMALAGVFDLTFVAGDDVSQDLVVATGSTPATLSSLSLLANTGIEFFFRFAVLYDSVNGQMGFKSLN